MYNHNRPVKTVCFQKTRISTVRRFHIGMVGLAWGDHTLWSSLHPDPSPIVQETTSTQLVWHTLIVHAVNASDDLGQRRGCWISPWFSNPSEGKASSYLKKVSPVFSGCKVWLQFLTRRISRHHWVKLLEAPRPTLDDWPWHSDNEQLGTSKQGR